MFTAARPARRQLCLRVASVPFLLVQPLYLCSLHSLSPSLLLKNMGLIAFQYRYNSNDYSSLPLSSLGFSLPSFFLPAFFSDASISHSICPFTLLNSSTAHLSRALYTSSSSLSTNVFFAANVAQVERLNK